MINKLYLVFSLTALMTMFSIDTSAESANVTAVKQQVYKLSYVEREPGIDDFEVSMLVSDRYIRIDEVAEDSGYILYDDKDKVIYSVGHHDHSVLVIKPFSFTVKDSPVVPEIEYLQLADAPKVSGNDIFNYRVFVNADNDAGEAICMELQLVENILPEVRKILKNYQMTVSGQQVKMVDNKITDMQTACYYVDQIYDTGAYYDKGLPIQEWHSNEHFKVLTSYEKVDIKNDLFSIPEDYKKFSIDPNSKTLLK